MHFLFGGEQICRRMFAVVAAQRGRGDGAQCPSARLFGHRRGASMGEVPELNTTIRKTLELASRCSQTESTDNYGALGDQVEELEGQAREAFQAKMNFASLLSKLKAGKPLMPADLKTLELLIVGDAEYFLKYETEFDRWKNEIQELVGEISKLQSEDLDVEGLMHLRALCAEVRRVLPAVVYYLDQKERARKFQQAMQGPIDADASRVLIEIIEQMLVSDKM
jgi:hypothetical protein